MRRSHAHELNAWQDPVIWSKSFQLKWQIGHDHGSLSPKQTNITTYVWYDTFAFRRHRHRVVACT